jgi:hypothetical protein
MQKVTLNIKFVGDSHVSPYPKGGLGQYVMRRQLKPGKRLQLLRHHQERLDGRRPSRLFDELVLARSGVTYD